MVKAELEYNPYLLETIIKFNGREPRINSRVEKYLHSNLQDWINDIPEIFIEEMNGGHFEIIFSGTVTDYNEVTLAFEKAGAFEDNVIISHKEKLGERSSKNKQIKELLDWFESSPNNNFTYDKFREKNEELFDDTYPLVVLQNKRRGIPGPNWADVSIEQINETADLNNTDLNNVPVVVTVGSENINSIQETTKFLKKRNDVSDSQVFFLLDRELGLEQSVVIRTLMDLGYNNPQIVSELNSSPIRRYYELYPQTEYIHSVIKVLRHELALVEEKLKEKDAISKVSNSENNEKAKKLENRIERLKEADSRILNREKMDILPECSQAKIDLLLNIINWRKKKTKITSEEDAMSLSIELSKEISFNYDDFSKRVFEIEQTVSASISSNLKDLYVMAEYDKDFFPKGIKMDKFIIRHTPRIEQELMNIKEYFPVRKKEQGLFFVPKYSNDELDIEMETTYYTQKWREYSVGIVEQMADSLIQSRVDAIKKYEEQIAETYHDHLTDLINQFESEREIIIQHLSDEEKQFQTDKKWLAEFKNKMKIIERG